MSNQDRNDIWQERIDALIDGELTAGDTERLKAAASEDARLAAAIINAYRIQNELEQLGTERAPKALQKRLRRIPRQHPGKRRTPWGGLAVATASAMALVLAIGLLQPRAPSDQELNQARQDLAVAFSYLQVYGQQVQREIKQEVGGKLQHAITTPGVIAADQDHS